MVKKKVDDNFLDSTGIDFKEDPLSDEDLDQFILSPEGDPEKLQAYRELFPDQADK